MSPSRIARGGMFVRVIQVLLSAVCLVSSMIHLGNSYYFLGSVYAYGFVNEWVGLMLAGYLPYLELALAISIWFAELRPAALILMCGLFAMYAGAQGLALFKGLKISCGCFGPSSDEPISGWSLGFATFLFFATFFCFVGNRPSNRAEMVP